MEPGDMVIKQGDEGSDYYVVRSGMYSVSAPFGPSSNNAAHSTFNRWMVDERDGTNHPHPPPHPALPQVLIDKLGDTPVHTYYPGGSFGELALLYNKPRAASIKCKEAGVLYALDRGTFRAVLTSSSKSTVDKQVALLKRVPLLEGLTDAQMQALW